MNYSRQRAEVLDQIREHEDHPTADVIFAELRQKDPSISLATVYRNLKLLSDLGEIRKLSFVSGADRFDPTVKPHYHFVCERCGKVYDIPMKVAEAPLQVMIWCSEEYVMNAELWRAPGIHKNKLSLSICLKKGGKGEKL